jgi:hypothetical protein
MEEPIDPKQEEFNAIGDWAYHEVLSFLEGAGIEVPTCGHGILATKMIRELYSQISPPEVPHEVVFREAIASAMDMSSHYEDRDMVGQAITNMISGFAEVYVIAFRVIYELAQHAVTHPEEHEALRDLLQTAYAKAAFDDDNE